MWQTLWQSIMDLFIDCKSICITYPSQTFGNYNRHINGATLRGDL